MTEIWFYKERFDLIEQLVRQTYDRLAQQAIEVFKNYPKNSRMSGDDSVLENVWEEYKYQLQREQGFFFQLYEDEIEQVCDELISKLPDELCMLLWIWTRELDSAWSDEGEEVSFKTFQRCAVVQKLAQSVADVAMNEDLLVDPDEERDREQYELDKWRDEDED